MRVRRDLVTNSYWVVTENEEIYIRSKRTYCVQYHIEVDLEGLGTHV